jgi:hypothetical protein
MSVIKNYIDFQFCNEGTFLNFHKERRCGSSKMKLRQTYEVEPKVKWIYTNQEKKRLMWNENDVWMNSQDTYSHDLSRKNHHTSL